MDEDRRSSPDRYRGRKTGLPKPRTFQDRYYDLHATLATTKLHQTIRDGISDTLAMHSMKWKRKDMGSTWDRNFKLRMYRRDRAKRPVDSTGLAAEFKSNMVYRYAPLNSSDDIRLLRLLPGRGNDSIACVLIHTTCSPNFDVKVTAYEALSYTWGPKIMHTINCDGAALSISENLWLALQRLRRGDSERLLWVDAICINQPDVVEKSAQVQRMRGIYSRAKKVVVWLGEGTEDTAEAFKLIERLSRIHFLGLEPQEMAITIEGLKSLELPDPDAPTWKTLDEILWRDWYFRVWILQEILVARDIVVTCGSCSVGYIDFVGAGLFIEYGSLTALTGVDSSSIYHVQDPRSGEIPAVHGRAAQDSPLAAPKVLCDSFYRVLCSYRDSYASDPRDKVFALLGLVFDSTPADYLTEPDYSKTVEDVYRHVAVNMVTRTEGLDILSAVEDAHFRLNSRLPSWVPDWETHPPSRPFFMLDSSVLWEGWKAAGFAMGHQANVSFRDHRRCLRIKGAIIDECLQIADTFLEHLPLSGTFKSSSDKVVGHHVFNFHAQRRWRQWAKLARKIAEPYATGESVDEAYARTIVVGNQDLTPLSNSVPTDDPGELGSEYYKAVLRLWHSNVVASGEDVSTLPTDRLERKLLMKFAKAHQQAAYGRRFFITRGGYMGLCHSHVRAGDRVVLLAGGRTPYILKTKRSSNARFRFAGECYLHGRMHGEAMKDPDAGVFDHERWFDIY